MPAVRTAATSALSSKRSFLTRSSLSPALNMSNCIVTPSLNA